MFVLQGQVMRFIAIEVATDVAAPAALQAATRVAALQAATRVAAVQAAAKALTVRAIAPSPSHLD